MTMNTASYNSMLHCIRPFSHCSHRNVWSKPYIYAILKNSRQSLSTSKIFLTFSTIFRAIFFKLKQFGWEQIDFLEKMILYSSS